VDEREEKNFDQITNLLVRHWGGRQRHPISPCRQLNSRPPWLSFSSTGTRSRVRLRPVKSNRARQHEQWCGCYWCSGLNQPRSAADRLKSISLETTATTQLQNTEQCQALSYSFVTPDHFFTTKIFAIFCFVSLILFVYSF